MKGQKLGTKTGKWFEKLELRHNGQSSPGNHSCGAAGNELVERASECSYYTSNPWPSHLTSYSANYACGGRGFSAHVQDRLKFPVLRGNGRETGNQQGQQPKSFLTFGFPGPWVPVMHGVSPRVVLIIGYRWLSPSNSNLAVHVKFS